MLKTQNFYLILLFGTALIIHFSLSLVGWNNTIFDLHDFRQSQTAITTLYILKEGFRLNYITPILGAPWSIPMEFPIYQWLVAALVSLLKTPLEQTGRLVSLLSFYLSLFPIYSLLSYFIKNKNNRLLLLVIILFNPLYLFWSRTFMIESMTLFFCLMFLWGLFKFLDGKKPVYLVLTVIMGSFGGLLKITTFAAFCFPALMLFLLFWWRKSGDSYSKTLKPSSLGGITAGFRKKNSSIISRTWFTFRENKSRFAPKLLLLYAFYGFVMVIIPLIISLVWIHYADLQKSFNPLADFLNSKTMSGWNFGTLKQRLSPHVWFIIMSHSTVFELAFGASQTWGKIILFTLLGVLASSVILNLRYRREILFCFLFWLFPPLVFTNLYYVHTYYSYASGVFISIGIGFLFLSLWEIKKVRRIIFIFALPAFLTFCLWLYGISYYPAQKNNNLAYQTIAEAISKNVPKDGVLLIYGLDWNASLPYASERKSIMDMRNLPLTDSKIQKSLKELGELKIKGMVIAGDRPTDFIQEQIDYFGFLPNPIYENDKYKLYISP